jgi:tetratricopeptide (TPR) repeat protein
MLSEKADPKVLSLLAAERLVRSRGTGDEIEPYHDRIRETVAAHLPADRARAHHLWLANAFARQEPLQPEAVALHFHSAGDAAAASPYAEAAAERAIQTLAFNQAVALFGIALEDPALSPERARRLRRRLGDALTDAGRAAEAAAAYNAAAEGAPPAERIELLRLAGERLLVSGHFDKGYETMRQVLETVGVSFPETPRAALWSLMWRRAYLAVRGLGYKLRPAESIPPRRLLMMDAFATLVSGFAPIDPVRAMDFQSRLMMHALRAGEMVRLSRAFALEVGVVATGGGRADTKRQIRTAQTLVDQAGDPAGNYLLASTAGMASFFLGRWDETIERLSVAMRLYPATGAGTSWVIASGKLCMLVSWIYSGNLIHAAEQFPGMIADARGRGDLHAQTSLRCRCAAFPMLAAGQPERVWPEVQDAISHWSQRGYHLQHFWALLSLVEADLYCGDAETAWRRVQADWPSFQGSLLRKLQLIHIEAHQVRARAALACAARGTDSARFLAIALKHAKTIEREEVAWGKGLALLIRAGVMHTSGRDCTASLASAEALLRESGMRLYAAAAARRLAQLRKDSESLRAADSFMASQRIADPARIVEALAPGLGSVQ